MPEPGVGSQAQAPLEGSLPVPDGEREDGIIRG
jgi:hypothetical protein